MRLELLHCLPVVPPPSDQPPLLFIHGSYCGAWVWMDFVLPRCARAGHAAYAVSLRGHGDSEGEVALASLSDYIEDVRQAIAHIGGRCVLIGHSMGGAVAQHCLADEPGVVALALLASVPPSGLGGTALSLLMTAPDLWLQFGLLSSLGPAAVSEEGLRRAILSDQIPAEEAARLLSRFQAESQRIALDLAAPRRPRLPPSGDWPPVLTMGGDRDPLIPVSALRETTAYFGGELAILAGAPHGLMLDPAWRGRATDHLLDWLDRTLAHGKA